METKHTPGPWHFRMFYRPIAKDKVPRIYDAQGRDIAETISPDDARLITAAPDLLAALKYWFDSKADPAELARMARAAIEKAEGRA